MSYQVTTTDRDTPVHDMSAKTLMEALAQEFPDQGSVVFIQTSFDQTLYGNPIVSVALKFGRAGHYANELISIEYAERFGDLRESIRAELERLAQEAA